MYRFVILLLSLWPSVALAGDCYFYPPCGKRINETSLLNAIQAQAPEARLEVQQCGGLSKYPYTTPRLPVPDWIRPQDIPIDTEAPWTYPAVVMVYNIPDQYTCTQVRGLLTSHNPIEDTYEEKRRLSVQRKDQQLNDLPTIKQILQRLEALENAGN